jgi:7-carboxy-7-deazaguanine synthase
MKAGTLQNRNSLTHVSVPLMEMFDTIQGEGFHYGKAAFFIRTAGCDVGCHWCDVKESWPEDQHPRISFDKIIAEVDKSHAEIIVLTGGEPMMHDLDILTDALKQKGKKIHIETSGAYPLTGEFEWICFSPKKFKEPRNEYYNEAHELKVVIYHPSDLTWAEQHSLKMHAGAKLFLQPEWSRRDQIMPMIVDYIKANPKWRISLQTHKYLNIP